MVSRKVSGLLRSPRQLPLTLPQASEVDDGSRLGREDRGYHRE